MGRISSSVGLISGINSKDIIDQLMKLESAPKTLLQTRLDAANQQKLAYTDLVTRLTSLRITATGLKKQSTFENAKATSGDENVLTATASAGAATGSFQFQVARLVTTQQSISTGFADPDSSKLTAGKLTIELGGGELSTPTPLAQLNGGAGVRRGLFRITDRSGKSAVIDTTSAVSLEDVAKKINTALDITVRASVTGEGLKLKDLTGAAAANLAVVDLADGSAAADLGIAQSVAAADLTGADINAVGRGTLLAQLNDGRGVRKASAAADFTITAANNQSYDVSLAGVTSVGQLIDAVKTATGGVVTMGVDAGANNLHLIDSSGGGGQLRVAAKDDSSAAADLGILTAGVTGRLDGKRVLAGLGTVLLGSLNGGQGLTLGSMNLTDKAGATATIDLSGAATVRDVLDLISNDARFQLTAKLTAAGNGIQLIDDSGGAGKLKAAEAGGTTAADLGLLGETDDKALAGKNLQRQWVSENTLLSGYNGGKGVARSRFRITNSAGKATEISLASGTVTTMGDLIKNINVREMGVTARINATGDGLLLEDAAGGQGKLKVEDVDGTAAADLGIKGVAATAATTIDGSMERTIDVTANDTLATLQTKVNNLSFGVTASIVNDGSGSAPFRLSLTARNSGRGGRVVIDGGATGVNPQTLVEAQDAAVFLGGADAAQPLLLTAGTNQLAGVLKGVTIDLHGVSDKPVALNITRSADNLVTDLGKFVESFNGMADKVKEFTKYDSETKERGLLLGQSAIQGVEAEMYTMLQSIVPGAGKYRILADVGLKIGAAAKLEFDEDKFRAAYATAPDDVRKLFTLAETGVSRATEMRQINKGKGIRAFGGTTADFKVQLHDGSSVDVALGNDLNSLGNVLDAINAAGTGKFTADVISETGAIRLTDLTAGAGTLAITALNGSQSVADLGLTAPAASGNALDGKKLAFTAPAGASGGAAFVLESRINKLIDPVSGLLTRENKTIDTKTRDFQDRMDSLDKIIEQKRDRLTRQFSNMESVLASLQSQQSALSSMSTFSSSNSRSNS